MGDILTFQPKPKLSPGERPRRRTDGDRLADMARTQGFYAQLTPEQQKAAREYRGIDSAPFHEGGELIAHAKQGGPIAPCEGCETQCDGCKVSA